MTASFQVYRLYFGSEDEYQAAMARALQLEAKGMKRRAWRVRMNFDGTVVQKVVAQPVVVEVQEEVQAVPAPEKDYQQDYVGKRKTYRMDDLVRQSGVSMSEIARQLGVRKQSVSLWKQGGFANLENYQKLKAFVEGRKK